MTRNTFYRYNPATDSYDRVYPDKWHRCRAVLNQCVWGVIVGLAVFIVAYNCIDFPREKELKQANERLEGQLELLNRRTDEALSVMDNIAARDNNFYRVVMQTEPLTSAARYAGLERQRYYDQLDSISDPMLVKLVTDKLDQLDNMIYNQIKSFDFLCTQLTTSSDRISHIPAIQPISSKYLKTMASGYGYRTDPIYGTTKFHEGMDFSADIGTPVYATGDGVVKEAKWNSGYGNMVEINHGFNYVTRYAHLSKMTVRAGQSVKRGDLIGRVGNSGKSTGPHLHYEVRYHGVPQNPVNYYFMDLTAQQYDEMIQQAENAGHVMD